MEWRLSSTSISCSFEIDISSRNRIDSIQFVFADDVCVHVQTPNFVDSQNWFPLSYLKSIVRLLRFEKLFNKCSGQSWSPLLIHINWKIIMENWLNYIRNWLVVLFGVCNVCVLSYLVSSSSWAIIVTLRLLHSQGPQSFYVWNRSNLLTRFY